MNDILPGFNSRAGGGGSAPRVSRAQVFPGEDVYATECIAGAICPPFLSRYVGRSPSAERSFRCSRLRDSSWENMISLRLRRWTRNRKSRITKSLQGAAHFCFDMAARRGRIRLYRPGKRFYPPHRTQSGGNLPAGRQRDACGCRRDQSLQLSNSQPPHDSSAKQIAWVNVECDRGEYDGHESETRQTRTAKTRTTTKIRNTKIRTRITSGAPSLPWRIAAPGARKCAGGFCRFWCRRWSRTPGRFWHTWATCSIGQEPWPKAIRNGASLPTALVGSGSRAVSSLRSKPSTILRFRQNICKLDADACFGPIADALTHVGQLAMLRRAGGSPAKGENYFVAEFRRLRGPDSQLPEAPV